MNWRALPGGDLIADGLADLSARRVTQAAALVSIGAPRLRTLGVAPEHVLENPERCLYDLLAAEGEDGAHSRYNAMVRRLVSFERAIACVR